MPLAVLEGQQQPDRSRVRTECVGAAQLSSWAAKLKTREAGLDEKPPEEAPRTPKKTSVGPAHGKVYCAYWSRLTATVRVSVTPSSGGMSKS